MKSRRVYCAPDLAGARLGLDAARNAGIADADVLLVARSDIELDVIPDARKEADTGFMRGAARGAGMGGAVGALGGLIAVVTPLGVTIAGAAAIAAAGALVGSWAASLAGASLPDPIRREFESEIESGRILLVIDAEDEALDRAEPSIVASGARRLPFEATSALA